MKHTDIVGFVEDYDRILRNILGYLFCNFGVEKVMERINYYVGEGHLKI